MEIKWETDAQGDFMLDVDGIYFGLVCPHEDRFTSPVAVWGGNTRAFDTIKQAKRFLKAEATKRS